MDYKVDFKGSYSMLRVLLNCGESIKSEPGSMLSMSGNIEIQTDTGGGFLKAVKRSFLGGESFFMNTFYALSEAEVCLAPELPGDIEVVDINSELFVQSTSFLACDTGIDMDTRFGGMKSFFSGEGLFMLHLRGSGRVAISSFGAIFKKYIAPGEVLTVDTGHIVAFDGSVSYSIDKFGSWSSTILGGEGLVCRFTGPGNVYIQTRNVPAFIDWIKGYIPTRETGSR
ncbi:MAG TPA: TIGR00266 family protein [Petrotogaceae bacterium]|nr:TIGR00266 family protein [Petrotogaceae bacterium]HQF32072.1 TIGR00266 family protein [Petrotogaceae bacterium]HQH31928.1 TIGR00266 family protein [Petrotogaceae bacterium]HQI78142.1 TIGR00266 family protein [Petrotogaceae bacterium]